MPKKRKLILEPDAIPQSLLQRLEKFRTEIRVKSLDILVRAAVEVYVDLVESPDVMFNAKLQPMLPELLQMEHRQKRVLGTGNEPMGKVLSLVPYLDPECHISEKT